MSTLKECWDLKKCPAGQYLNCSAFLEKKRCWEVANPRCSRSLLMCLQLGCPVYEVYTEEIDREIRNRLKMMYPLLENLDTPSQG